MKKKSVKKINRNAKNRNGTRTIIIKKRAIIMPIAIIALIIFFINSINNKTQINPDFELTPEILKSREYQKVNSGDENTDSSYVKFDAFFLKDLDGDGNADSIRGTCNEVGKEDTLYMDLKVLNNGYFKDGVITINGDNFYLSTAIVKDNVVTQNYIGSDTREIKLKNMQNGSQKLLTGVVRSGDYSNSYSIKNAIGNFTDRYSKINSIRLTGTHVADNGKETAIDKTIDFTVDWYGETKANIEIENVKNAVNDLDELIDGDNINLNFTIKTAELKNQLILKSSNIEGTIPELNGYKANSLTITGDNITYTYDNETGNFTAKREAILNDNQFVTSYANTSAEDTKRCNSYNFNLVYPKEAYENMETTDIHLLIPIKTWYEGFNNPNPEFTNPYISNVAETTIIARWEKYDGNDFRFDIMVGKEVYNPFKRRVISKEKPLRILNGISEEESEDYYDVVWQLRTGPMARSSTVTMKETANGQVQASDFFVKTNSSRESMEDISSVVQIFFAGARDLLGEEGWIKLYNDETNELIETFTKDTWMLSNKYKFERPVKHIRIETSNTNPDAIFEVYMKKEIDDKYLTEKYDKDVFDSFQYIRSNLTGYFGENSSSILGQAYYEAPSSIATIKLSKNEVSTQETCENQIITISTSASNYNEQKWKNGTFLVKMPAEIIDMSINNVSIENENISILGYDLYEEDGVWFIKILTANEEEDTFDIKIDCNFTPDPRSTTITKPVELYAKNGQTSDYYYKQKDIYDIDGNLNEEEFINKKDTNISFIAPNELLTNQIASNYNDKNSITIAPKIAKTEKSQRTADIDVNITNNYTQEISNVLIQGVIPFEGNKFVIGNAELGSTFTATMSAPGITIPEQLKDYVTIYYSTEEQPTKDINDENNKWKTKDNVSNWNDIKTYIIDLGEYKLTHGESYTFKYEINLPLGLEYNQVSYSEHGIYFSLMTEQGKYETSTAANKLGFMIAKQYDLEIEKFQKGTTKKIPEIMFSITEEGKEDSKIKVTNEEGKILLTGLYAEKTYVIKEIKAGDEYALNNEEIKMYTYTDQEDKLHLAYKNDDGAFEDLAGKYNCIKSAQIIEETNKDYKIKLDIENEVKININITKKNGENNLQDVTFKLNGKGQSGTILKTNSLGEVSAKGLYLNETYTLQETNAKGYYLPDTPTTFKITQTGSEYNLEITGERIITRNITKENEIPTINLQIDNEKIPEYSLKIVKKEKDTETLLKGTQFTLQGEDKRQNLIYETDENGTIRIDNLYEYVEGKNIEAVYTLQEIYPTEGYILKDEPIVFKAQRNGENNLEFKLQSGKIKGDAEVDNTDPNNPVITIIIENEPVFTLNKIDEETNEPLEGVEFTIKDSSGNSVTDANGNTINNIKTDANGKARLSLEKGNYVLTETKAIEGYEELTEETRIAIGESKKADYDFVKEKETTERIRTEGYFIDSATINDGFIALSDHGEIVKYDFDGYEKWSKNDGYVAITVMKNKIDAVDLEEGSNTYNRTDLKKEDVIAAIKQNGYIELFDLKGNMIHSYDLGGTINKNVNAGCINVNAGTIDNQIYLYSEQSGRKLKWIFVNFSGNYVRNSDGTFNTQYGHGCNISLTTTQNISENSGEFHTGICVLSDGVITCAYNGGTGILTKYDRALNLVWRKTYEPSSSGPYLLTEPTAVNDGILICSYYTGQIIKFDFNGNEVWKTSPKSSSWDFVVVPDGIITITQNGVITKYDLEGNLVKENTANSQYTGIYTMTIAENEIISLGVRENRDSIIKYDFELNQTDYKISRFGGTTQAIKVNDGVITTDQRGNLAKYDFKGNLEWRNNDKGANTGNLDQTVLNSTFKKVNDGVVVLIRGNDHKLLKYDFDGNLVWERNVNNDGEFSDTAGVLPRIIMELLTK